MSQSFSKIYVHLIWHTKIGGVSINKEDRQPLYSMLGKALEDLSCKPVCINGTGDHVHILLSLGRECSISKCAMQLKRLSSSWIEKRDPHYRGFHWQNGYGAFSVSQSGVDKVVQYISNQEEHHKRMSFREEFRKFLDLYHIDYDANYLPGYE